jgi:Holliday junction resolvase RusA-like endonuclease
MMLERTPAAEAISIELSGEPRGKGRPRSRIARTRTGLQFVQVYTDAETRKYEDRLRAAAALAMHGRDVLTGPLCVMIVTHFPVPASWSKRKRTAAMAGELRPTGKPDWDNIAKISSDAFNGVVWTDDSQIVEGSVTKLYSREPALLVTVRPIEIEARELGLFEGAETGP